MVAFFVKSILSLGILNVFYWLILNRLKTFTFNRYFLLGSLFFSLVIPFISISVDNDALPLIQSAGHLSISNTIEYSGAITASKEVEQNTIVSFLPYFYIVVSLILFVRFALNLFNIIKKIIDNQKIEGEGYSIVLLENQIIPYSFFGYVLVNKRQYQDGAIDEALIQHEISHCRQWHSLDILIVELLKVFFWANPFIWSVKRSVQLNHEFLADDSVLSNHDLTNYKNLLVNLVIKQNSGMLISNFNFSVTKQRLKMMTKTITPLRTVFGKFSAILLVLIIVLAISCHQVGIEPSLSLNDEDEWWRPILKEHNIKPAAYNNFNNIFEMGTKNSINDGIVTLENAFFLFQLFGTKEGIGELDSYIILEAPFATHNLKFDSINAKVAKMRTYSFEDGKLSKISHFSYAGLKMIVNDKKFWIQADNGVFWIESSEGEILHPKEYINNSIDMRGTKLEED